MCCDCNNNTTSRISIMRCSCCQAGPFSWEHPIALSFYIFIRWFCAASAECRASSDVAICRQSVSQSESRWSTVKQSSRRQSSVARSSLVDCRLINK